MKVTIEYVPQYKNFDDYFNPIGLATDHQWVVDILKSPTESYHVKLPTRPTKRQLRKLIKGYLHK